MHIIDYVIYIMAMLGIGLYFLNKNKTVEIFYVSGRKWSNWHIGLSVVAASRNIVTDSTAQFSKKELTLKKEHRPTQIIALLVGFFAILSASPMQNLLKLMTYSYGFWFIYFHQWCFILEKKTSERFFLEHALWQSNHNFTYNYQK